MFRLNCLESLKKVLFQKSRLDPRTSGLLNDPKYKRLHDNRGGHFHIHLFISIHYILDGHLVIIPCQILLGQQYFFPRKKPATDAR